MRKCLRIHVFGRVQGVFFRQSAKIYADEFGVRGWVKNTAGGSVEILAEGEEGGLERFLAWAKKGPDLAEIEQVDVRWSEATGEFERFEVR